jgi:bifunctional non-homologous end joining protein LigD
VAFDLLYLESDSLMEAPFIQRRAALEKLFKRVHAQNIVLAESLIGDGKQLFAAVSSFGLEGVMGKYIHAPYTSGKRSSNWLKIKC